jgi:hypothetical protein
VIDIEGLIGNDAEADGMPSPEQAGTEYDAAQAAMLDAAVKSPLESRAQAIARLNQCYAAAVAIHDTKTAISAQSQLNRLLNLQGVAAPVSHGAQSLKFVTLTEAAEQLGCTDRHMRDWANGKAGPALDFRVIAGKRSVQPALAYDHIRQHSKRLPPGLHPPPGYDGDAGAPPAGPIPVEFGQGRDDDGADTADLFSLLAKLSDSKEREKYKPSEIHALAAAARGVLAKQDSDRKAASSIEAAEVIEMIKDHRGVFVEEIDGAAPADATALVKWCRENLDIDLTAKNISAVQLLEQWLCERSNRILASLSKRVDEQVAGVRLLELGGERT